MACARTSSRVGSQGAGAEGWGSDMCTAGGCCGNWTGSGPISMSGIV